MTRGALIHLRDLGGICGREIVEPPTPTRPGTDETRTRRKLCCLPRGHTGACAPDFLRRRLTIEERRIRQLAVAKARRDHHQRRVEHLRDQVRGRDAKIERLMEPLPMRVAYRIVGGRNRLRRYRAQLRRMRQERSARAWRW